MARRYKVDDGGAVAFRKTPVMSDRSDVHAKPGEVIAAEERSGAGEEPAEDPDLRTQAWQILETARIILGRRASRPKRDTLMLADVHMRCLRAPRSPPPAPRRPCPAARAPPERMGS